MISPPCSILDETAWQPNFTWITDEIAVGGRFPIERASCLAQEHGIGAVVDLRSEDRDEEAELAVHRIAFLHLPTDDHHALSARAIEEGLAFVEREIAARRRVLIHCEHGIGRSATLALCALVRQGFAPLQALELAKGRRSLISPSPAQYECWAAWLRGFREAHGVDWEVPSFDEFKPIAYRHLYPG